MDSGVVPVLLRSQMRPMSYDRGGWELFVRRPGELDDAGSHRAEDAPAGEGGPVRPPVVVVAGVPVAAKVAVMRELLQAGDPVLWVPEDSYLVVRHGADRMARAYLPGSKAAQAYPSAAVADPIAAGAGAAGATGTDADGVDCARAAGAQGTAGARGSGARMGGAQGNGMQGDNNDARMGGAEPGWGEQPGVALPRPPRRVELTLPAPLLTSFTLVRAPDAGRFGPAYTRIVLDTAERGGALLVTMDARVLPNQAELDFLVAAAQRGVVPFFAVWVGDQDGDPAEDDDPARTVAAYRDVVASRAPGFAEAPWFLVAPGSGAAELGQALAGWARAAGQRPAAGPGTVGARTRRAVPTAVDGRESGWEGLLDRVVKAAQHSVRQGLAIELANIHLRCVQDIVFGAGCPGLAAALDREMHALSLRGAEEVDAAITEITRQVLAHVLAEAPYDEVLGRVAEALRQRIEEDGPQLDRILLITSTGGVAAMSGSNASAGLGAYHPRPCPGVLPPLGIGLSASCYQKWRDESKADQPAARDWLQQAVRGTELELQRVLAERFEAVHQVLGTLVAEAVDHGLLLV